VTVYEVKGSLEPLDDQEQHYSIDLAEAVVHEFKLELICEDALADQVVEVIRTTARTGQETAGWICVVDLERVVLIGRG
jgi:nitrogen regulatory protein P-II 1